MECALPEMTVEEESVVIPDRPIATLQIIVSDPHAGLVRILDDMRRLGLTMKGVRAEVDDNHAVITVDVALGAAVDQGFFIARLGRHPVVRTVSIVET